MRNSIWLCISWIFMILRMQVIDLWILYKRETYKWLLRSKNSTEMSTENTDTRRKLNSDRSLSIDWNFVWHHCTDAGMKHSASETACSSKTETGTESRLLVCLCRRDFYVSAQPSRVRTPKWRVRFGVETKIKVWNRNEGQAEFGVTLEYGILTFMWALYSITILFYWFSWPAISR
jgi:hypothetical protein